MTAPAIIAELVTRYRDNRDDYRSQNYKEFRLRVEFIDPFFKALGWDVANKAGDAEAYKEVVHEDTIKVGTASKAPDYAFRIGGTRKFFVETKAPSVPIKQDISAAYQLRRYGWSSKLPLSILTNFEEFAIYDCRIRPDSSDRASKARVLYIGFEEYEERWSEIEAIFGQSAIRKGAFDRYAHEATRKRGTAEVDKEFLTEIETWREALAKSLAMRNRALTVRELNTAVQQTIDRIIFLRIAEDRGFEPYGALGAITKGAGVYGRLVALFRGADKRYNSGLFHFTAGDGQAETLDTLTLALTIDDKVLRDILCGLYYPQSPYEFSVLPADILGQVYEQFLGKVINLSGRSATVTEKPAVRKAGGVYYTPTYIVRYIVKTTVGKVVTGKTYAQVSGEDKRAKNAAPIRVLDPACGSGSFLIEAYQYLLDWYTGQYISDGVERHIKGKQPRLYEASRGIWRLTISEKKRILLTHIFGVDIDAQAVEVTKLSLLMKVLEGEKGDALAAQMNLFHMRALPDLGNNIKCGNSLIGSDIYSQQNLRLSEDEETRINPFDWTAFIKEMTRSQRFDIVIGNPPYVLLEDDNRQTAIEAYIERHYKVASFKVDTYHLFIERGLQLLAEKGLYSFITPSNFLTNNHAGGLRNILIEGRNLSTIVNFKGRVFQSASVDTCIFLIDKAGAFSDIDFVDASPGLSDFSIIRRTTVPVKGIISDPKHVMAAASVDDAMLLAVVEKGTTPLGQLGAVNFGKQLRDRKRFTTDVIAGAKPGKAPVGYAKCYTGKNIQKYVATWSGLLCLTDRAAQSGGCWDDRAQNAKRKLLCKQIGKFPTFAIDNEGYQCLNTIFMVNLFDPKLAYYVLGILNSRMLQFYWLKKFYDHRTTFPKIKGTYLKQLPIRPNIAKPAVSQKISEYALTLTNLWTSMPKLSLETDRRRVQIKIQHTDAELNRAVYEIYDIKETEVKAIEGFLEKALSSFRDQGDEALPENKEI